VLGPCAANTSSFCGSSRPTTSTSTCGRACHWLLTAHLCTLAGSSSTSSISQRTRTLTPHPRLWPHSRSLSGSSQTVPLSQLKLWPGPGAWQLKRFNCAEDCPVFDGLFNFCQIYTGGSVGGRAAQATPTVGSIVCTSTPLPPPGRTSRKFAGCEPVHHWHCRPACCRPGPYQYIGFSRSSLTPLELFHVIPQLPQRH
jgi:hypothetical protein